MCMRNVFVVTVIIVAGTALAEDGPELGEAVSATDLAIADFSVLPNGDGLPEGSGNALHGAAVYAANCLACHGEGGVDGLNDRLVGGDGVDEIFGGNGFDRCRVPVEFTISCTP